MPNSKRMDEISARLAEVMAADARLNDNLSEAVVVLDDVPSPVTGNVPYRVYVDWPTGASVLSDPQPLTAMSFIRLEHTLKVWFVVFKTSSAEAKADAGRLLYNLMRILGDETEDADYWFAGRMESINFSDSHANLETAGDVRYRIGSIVFRILQELIV